tara:strand:+ start:23345 stop:23614 length:270 start_codon:yes stop_codon:yes gene_type:complete
MTASANAEVILAVGAINTPQILQLSGIGDGGLLSRLGLPKVKHAPDVGEHLQDHYQARQVYRATKPCTLNDDLRAPRYPDPLHHLSLGT